MPRDTVNSSGSKSKAADPSDDKLSLVLSELKDIKQEIHQHGSKLDTIENTTASLAEQLTGVREKTAKLETAVAANASGLKEMNEQLSALKATVAKQESIISNLTNLKEDIKKSSSEASDAVEKMNELVATQGDQVESFKSTTTYITQDVMSKVNKKIRKIKEESFCQSLKTQAYNSRLNLIIVGLAEEESTSVPHQVKNFITQTLKIQEVDVKAAYRIGSKPDEGSGYARPISVRFNNLIDRNYVWKNRIDITNEDPNQTKIRILADLPKPLREGIQALYKVANAASKMQEYQSARVKDYQLEMNDETYQFTELEELPFDIRPSTLAAPRSDTALAFYSRHSFFSNHFLSDMEIDGRVFSCMEHFLAFQKAVLSEKQPIIKRARQARDPLQAKHILNLLKDDHAEEWSGMIEEITLEGLREKFKQNDKLQTYLLNTGTLFIGEASVNPRWGIGMNLADKEVLDHTKWNNNGNLLGKTLMKVRDELLAEQPP